MSAYTHPVARAVPQAVRQLVWFALVCTVAFFVPYLGISVLAMQHDVFYLAYFAVTLALLAALCAGRACRCSGGLPPPLAVEPRHRRRARGRPRLQRLQHRTCDGSAARPLLRLRAALAWCRLRPDRHAPADGVPLPGRLPALARPRRRAQGQAPAHGVDAAAGDHRDRDLPPGLPPVPAGRDQPTRDRQRPDLDPDLRDREPGRLDRRARLPTRRRRHAQLRVARSSTHR